MVKRIYKFATGQEVQYPNEARYLTTLVEIYNGERLVWHYFLVEDGN